MTLPYDGIIRTGSKGMSHFAGAKTPTQVHKLLESHGQRKPR